MLPILTLALVAQSTWYVDAAAVPPGNGSIAAPYTRIDFAVAQPTTLDGDTIAVNGGTYTDERIEFGNRALVIDGLAGAAGTIVEGSATGSIVSIDDPSDWSILRGLTFRDGIGTVDPLTGESHGGAILANDARLRIEGCVFRSCTADRGGAIACVAPAPSNTGGWLEVVDTLFEPTCRANLDGGAIHALGVFVQVEGCVAEGHATHGRGGAVFSDDGDVIVEDSRIIGTAPGNGGAICMVDASPVLLRTAVTGRCAAGGLGGGVYMERAVFSRFEQCRFEGCRALSGGAVYGKNSRVRSFDSWFVDNATTGVGTNRSGQGGAIWCLVPAIVDRSVFIHNRALHHPEAVGGAIFGSMAVVHSTFMANEASLDGASVFVQTNNNILSDVRRSILTRAPGTTTPAVNAAAHASGNLIEGGFPGGLNNSGEDPLLWGPSDPHLLPGSPAIGNNLKGAFAFDPDWCGEGCDGPIGLVSCVAQPHSLGYPAVISGLGSVNIATDRVILNVTSVPHLAAAYFIAGNAAGFVPGAGGGTGTLCLGGLIQRFPIISTQGAPPTASFRPLLGAFPSGHVVTAGESWFFQLWFRDSSPNGPTSNFSPALFVQF